MWRVQTWWGDSWSYGTIYRSKPLAQKAARELRKEGWKVRIVKE